LMADWTGDGVCPEGRGKRTRHLHYSSASLCKGGATRHPCLKKRCYPRCQPILRFSSFFFLFYGTVTYSSPCTLKKRSSPCKPILYANS
jgi:hypothetical protein